MREECEMLRGIKYDDNHMSEQLTQDLVIIYSSHMSQNLTLIKGSLHVIFFFNNFAIIKNNVNQIIFFCKYSRYEEIYQLKLE